MKRIRWHNKFVCLHGIPQNLVTDCGTEFLSNVFKEVSKVLKVQPEQNVIKKVPQVGAASRIAYHSPGLNALRTSKLSIPMSLWWITCPYINVFTSDREPIERVQGQFTTPKPELVVTDGVVIYQVAFQFRDLQFLQ